MTNKDITKIYFQGNEIVALYRGDTLIFKKSSGGGSTTKPTGVYKIKGTVTKGSGYTQFNLTYNNGQRVNVKVNKDLTFETDLQEPLTNANAMFRGRSYLETLDLNGLDTSQVTNMSNMFSQSNYLKDIKLSNFDTSIVTDMSLMFYDCKSLTSLDVSNFDTSKVTSMEDMFNGCRNLTSLDVSNFDTSKVTQMGHMFRGCENLKSLDLSNFDTSKVTRLQYMFYDDEKLTDLYINFDVRLNTYFENIFSLCFSLENVVGKFEGTKDNLYLDSCSSLTAQSAMVFINGLATVTETRTLSLNATTYDSLTNEQIAIATAKGWTVTRS